MINISKNKCVGCGICESVCSRGFKVTGGVAEIKNKNADCLKTATKACPQKAIKDIQGDMVFAIGTDDGKNIKQDDHFGMSKYFQIWKFFSGTGDLKFQEKRENARYKEDETRVHGDPGKAKATSSVLNGVDVLTGKMMGPNIVRLKNKFVPAIIREPDIKKATQLIQENINEIFEEKEKSGEERKGIILK